MEENEVNEWVDAQLSKHAVNKLMTKADRREKDDDYTDVLGTDIQFPHCDALILHSPGLCEYCDRHPDWQALRSAQGIAFSDYDDTEIQEHNLIPCPSTIRRTAEMRDRWGGNRAQNRDGVS